MAISMDQASTSQNCPSKMLKELTVRLYELYTGGIRIERGVHAESEVTQSCSVVVHVK
jgi:hypothetical protein